MVDPCLESSSLSASTATQSARRKFPTPNGVTPMTFRKAAREGDQSLVLDMLKRCDPTTTDDKGRNMLMLAIMENRTEVAELLLQWRGPSNEAIYLECPDNKGCTALHLAISHATPQTVRFLLDHGAYIDAMDEDGNTTVHRAINEEKYDIVAILCGYRPDFAIFNHRGKTAMDLARQCGLNLRRFV